MIYNIVNLLSMNIEWSTNKTCCQFYNVTTFFRPCYLNWESIPKYNNTVLLTNYLFTDTISHHKYIIEF